MKVRAPRRVSTDSTDRFRIISNKEDHHELKASKHVALHWRIRCLSGNRQDAPYLEGCLRHFRPVPGHFRIWKSRLRYRHRRICFGNER